MSTARSPGTALPSPPAAAAAAAARPFSCSADVPATAVRPDLGSCGDLHCRVAFKGIKSEKMLNT